jgi:hypothetical protein
MAEVLSRAVEPRRKRRCGELVLRAAVSQYVTGDVCRVSECQIRGTPDKIYRFID